MDRPGDGDDSFGRLLMMQFNEWVQQSRVKVVELVFVGAYFTLKHQPRLLDTIRYNNI